MDGVYGSTGLEKLNKMKSQHSDDPGVKGAHAARRRDQHHHRAISSAKTSSCAVYRAGALDVNPEVFEVEAEELSASKRGIVFELPKSGMTDLDFDMECDSTKSKVNSRLSANSLFSSRRLPVLISANPAACQELNIDVRPVAMTFEEFYCGFTEDSHPSFTVTPTEGKMVRTTPTAHAFARALSSRTARRLCVLRSDEMGRRRR